MRRVGLVLATMGLTLGLAGPVSAAATHSHEVYDWQADTCGVLTDVHVTGDLVQVKWEQGTAWGGPTKVNVHDTFVYTNPADGHVAIYDWFGTMTQAYVGLDADGNILIRQTYYGLESRVRSGDGGVRAIDAGTLTLLTTWDASGSYELGIELVGMKGPHPMMVSDTALCDAILGALT